MTVSMYCVRKSVDRKFHICSLKQIPTQIQFLLLHAVQEFCYFLDFICSLAGWESMCLCLCVYICVSVERFLPNLLHAIRIEWGLDEQKKKTTTLTLFAKCDCWHSTNDFSHVPECRTLLCYCTIFWQLGLCQKPNTTDMPREKERKSERNWVTFSTRKSLMWWCTMK